MEEERKKEIQIKKKKNQRSLYNKTARWKRLMRERKKYKGKKKCKYKS